MAYDYDDLPVDGCVMGQLCWWILLNTQHSDLADHPLIPIFLSPSTAPYYTRYNYDETNVSSVPIICGVSSATSINAYGALFILEQTEAQTVGGVNTAAVSDRQPAITASAAAVTVTQSTSPGSTTSPPTPSAGSGTAPAATYSKAAGRSGGLAVGSEIGSIVGAICGAIALAVSVHFGWRGLEKRNEDKEKNMVAKEEAEKAAQGQPMLSTWSTAHDWDES
ncbi:hypothetical protein IMSHALPRED_002565 [Imshaugia aleurites]|uniref:Uncharacterized protein n=1 Tax=Imshaugia aleurites TaxID=172621 RepID=A0A8H3J6A4_9LECA|nr:hypothetical protein IMSHALPRED_002565 [Imshaugia aleurites]